MALLPGKLVLYSFIVTNALTGCAVCLTLQSRSRYLEYRGLYELRLLKPNSKSISTNSSEKNQRSCYNSDYVSNKQKGWINIIRQISGY